MNEKKIRHTISGGPFSASWDSLEDYTIPEWYEDAKFGIFIHWGVYSVPAFSSEWYARKMYQQSMKEFEHHVKTYGPHKKFGYKDFIPLFKAERYEPDSWADLFKQAGAKFVVPVAEHHDGFQMYKSSLSKWNAFEMGPKRDIIGELAHAVRQKDMAFGVSNHRAEHWWFFDGGREFDSDVPDYPDLYGPAEPKPVENYTDSMPDRDFLEDWLARNCELADLYHPDLLWFDWWIMNLAFKPYLKKFAAYYYNVMARQSKSGVINYKKDAYPVGTAVFDIERGQLSGKRGLYWQSDTSISRSSWGYVSEQDYKSSEEIICALADIVSKNGALLLNIGPKPDGTIPEAEKTILREIGEWLMVNGEGIYGTRPWKIHGEGPTETEEGGFTDSKKREFTSDDIRFTTKRDTLYAVLLQYPERDSVNIKSLGLQSPYSIQKIKDIKLLETGESLNWKNTPQGLIIDISKSKPERAPCVLAVSH
jgi:alpha-L-fucosidase